MEPPELTQDWGNRLLEDTQSLVCARIQEKGAVTPQVTDPDLPMIVHESPAKPWVSGGLLYHWGY